MGTAKLPQKKQGKKTTFQKGTLTGTAKNIRKSSNTSKLNTIFDKLKEIIGKNKKRK
jgi:hypothetical protein